MRLTRILTLTLITCSVGIVQAEEKIHSYHSDITINADGSLDVTETIEVTAEGNAIKHGIYRDFPTVSFNKLWFRKKCPFEVKQVTRDGNPEPYHLDESQGLLMNITRVYVGNENRHVPEGRHTYSISYHTDRWLHFHETQDELYWNVTGLEWKFPIEKATVTIHLPQEYSEDQIEAQGWTGPEGSGAQNWKLISKANGSVHIETTRPLEKYEGLTIAVLWPSGAVDAEPANFEIRENLSAAFAIAGLGATFAILWFGWMAVGKDPVGREEAITSDPPAELSPASARQLVRMKYDDECLSSALISAGQKGAISIHEDEKFLGSSYIIRKEDESKYQDLMPDEKILVNQLLKGEDEIALKQTHRTRIKAAVEEFKEYLDENLVGRLYVNNRSWVWMAAGVALACHAGAILTSSFLPGAAFISVWLTIWTLGVSLLGAMVYAAWKNVLSGSGNKIFGVSGAIFITGFATPFFIGEGLGLTMLALTSSIWVAVALIANLVLCVVFWQWMKAPTTEGRALLDQLEGYKFWLTEELPRLMNETANREEARDLIDQHLPWISALDLGGQTGEKLGAVLAAATVAGATGDHFRRHPHWYHGNNWTGLSNVGSFTGSLSSGVSTAMASSSGSSSSGGGGGSSGGGGGGGGGGGW